MKYDKAFKRLAHDERTFDQDAQSILECMKKYYPNYGRSAVEIKIKKVIDGGTWEQVWKRTKDGRIVKAYRPRSK